ncbi:MAG: 1-deoxy-D-xylulose-5-phosphate synthase, partial [candidate division WOR-3 bacterium]
LGLHYVGPVRGHHIPELISTLNQVKKINEPVIVHVLTKKGKGYTPAEKEPDKYHGITGTIYVKRKNPTYTEVFGKTIVELARRDKRIVAITAAMPDGTGLKYFKQLFPERFFDVGIAEAHAVTFAGGLATEGLIPVCAIYSTFLQRAYDQIVHDIALQKLHVVFCIDRAGIVGEDGATHQGIFDISYLRHIPNMVIMAPSSGEELKNMIYSAIYGTDLPVAIRYPKDFIPEETIKLDDFKELEIGKGEILQDGEDIVIWAIGSILWEALEASKIIELETGIRPKVVNAKFIKPIDVKLLLETTKSAKLVVTVEDNVVKGGFGSAVLEELASLGISAKTLLIGIPDEFPSHGRRSELLDVYGMKGEKLARRIIKFYGNNILR